MRTWLVVLALAVVAVAGCTDGPDEELVDTDGDGIGDTPRNRLPVVEQQPAMQFKLSDTGFRGPEPSVGVTSSGCIFFTALEKVMRSCDQGESWTDVHDTLVCQDGTSDPWLWVDPATDRIFNVQMVSLVGTWVCWSDDDGASWLGNPYDQGPLPVNDHIKLATGPWRTLEAGPGYGAIGGMNPTYESAVYFCYNKLVSVFCYTSFDGGMTFPVGGHLVGVAGNGGLHGTITSAPDGTVYVPPRLATPTVYMSKDNGLTWEPRTMGEDVGTTTPRKNSEVGTDAASNAYHTWIGADDSVYLSRSYDSGLTWEQTSILVSAPEVTSATFPHIDAGDPGRVAVAYLGSTDYDGNPQVADYHNGASHNATYHLWLSYSLDALEPVPTWQHVRLTDDPVQVGSICLNSGACSNGNRNLLDFNDLTLGPDGRIYIAFADGCTDFRDEPCASDAAARTPEASRDARGYVAIQTAGPSLFEEMGPFK